MKLLIVEDERRVADFLARGLAAEGYAVIHAADGQRGLELARGGDFAAIVLDVMLPGLSGRDVCAALRHGGSTVPILMLTALDAVEDRVESLRLGADDYLPKPFAFDELLARLEALIRRSTRWQEGDQRRLAVGALVFDRDTLAVTAGKRTVALTPKELAILELLMRRPGHVLSRARILSAVWGAEQDPLTNIVDVYIGRLRKKLGTDSGQAIDTMRGHGYRLVPVAGS